MRFTVIDTETTGLVPLRSTILEIAIVTIEDGRVVDRWSSKVKPTEEDLVLAHPKALEINGYAADPSAWDDAPSWDEVGEWVLGEIAGTMPVGHNVNFDLGMIREVNRRHGIKGYVPFCGVDTITLAIEHLVPGGLERFGLDSVRRWMGWSSEGAHTAYRDAEDTAKLFLLLHRATWWTRLRVRLGRWWRR